MKRISIILSLTLSVALSSFAAEDDRSVGLLQRLTNAIESLGSYEALFSLSVNGESINYDGRYEVDGEQYMLSTPGMMIYGDSSVRYSVDSLQQEVVIEYVVGAPMIVSNPARAFTTLDQVFDARMKYFGDEYYIIKLTPKVKDKILQSSELTLSRESNLPLSVSYRSDDDEVVIDIQSINSIDCASIPISYPEDYEVIDFR